MNENQIATARLAQLFGSELLRVDETTLQRPTSMNNAVQLDPRRFLAPQPQSQAASQIREQQILEQLNREAMAAYPTPPEPVAMPPAPPAAAERKIAEEPIRGINEDLLKQINRNLERIASAIELLAQPTSSDLLVEKQV